MTVFYSDTYTIPLPEGHKFPMVKYRMIRDALLERGILSPSELHESPIFSPDELSLAHAPSYITDVCNLTLDPKIVRRIGFPLTQDLVTRSLATVGGAVSASEIALDEGVSGNLAGGTHHALYDAGEGFCVFNDIAVAGLRLLNARKIHRMAIIDVDVHQGNGNSAILGDLPQVHIFSMHGRKNYPFIKVPSTIDIELEDGVGDDEYCTILSEHLPGIAEFKPDIVFYLGGSDPLETDSLGRLSLTHHGLAERDKMVFEWAHKHGFPVSLALGGGYSKPIEHTVNAHVQTFALAKSILA
ncbi:MAG: histone deacetylase [bacterium]